MPHLEIRLLGPFQVGPGGGVVTEMRSDKVRALLAYLAVEADQPHRREKLAGLLWPGYPEDSARASLRRALADLRQAIGDEQGNPPYLQVTRQTIQFDCSSHAWVDAIAFAAMSKNGKPVDENIDTSWEEALALYRGEFMEGFSLPDSPEFEGWLVVTREQFKRQVLETLQRLVGSLEERGEYQRGLGYAWQAVELEPMRESAQRGLMRLLALSGQRQIALKQYETCAAALKSELGMEPSAETRELYDQILRGKWPPTVSAENRVESRPPRQVGECPYRGLAAFREQDAPFFFGREEFTERLLSMIQQPQKSAVILGPSGSGKSSVAYAGLLPRLREEGGWLVVKLRPGASPQYSMAAALLPRMEQELSETDRLIESQKLASALLHGEVRLDHILNRILDAHGEEHILLLIDQFEELFTLCSDDDVRERFLGMLLDVNATAGEFQKSPYTLLLTMRADFMGEALAYRPFADALQRAALMLGPMTRQELRGVIEKPAHVQGATFEEGLVERILDDVGREPGNLPLLEFALTLLWDEISSGWLTHAGYERSGGVRGALASYADRVYDELNIDNRKRAQRIFTQLVRPGEGTEDTRRVATRSEIGEQDWPLVQHLADRRLVVTAQDEAGNETVEVVHEALIGNWDCLKGWIDEARTFRTWQERLRAALHQWKSSGRDEGALLRGAPLAEAEGWLAERAHELNQPEVEYIQKSVEQRESRQLERERTRRRISLGLGVGLVITLVLAILAGWQWRLSQQAKNRAELERDQTRITLARSLASQAELLLGSELDLASLLSIEAVNIDASVEAKASLLAALAEQPRLATILHGQGEKILSVAVSPDGRLVAAGDAAGGLYLYEFQDQDGLISPDQIKKLSGHTERISSLVFSPDGRLLASGGFDDRIYLWDVESGEQENLQLNQHRDNVWALTFSPDGKTLVSAGADGQILFWNLDSGQMAFGIPDERILATESEIVSSLALSPDGNSLAAGIGDGSLILWDLSISNPVGEVLSGHDRLVRTLTFSPDGTMLASGGDDGKVVLWETRRDSISFGKPITEPVSAHGDWVTSLAFSNDGALLTSAGKDGRVLSWKLSNIVNTGKLPSPDVMLDLHKPVWSLAYNPDERWLVTGGEQDAFVWDLSQLHPLAHSLGKHPNWVSELAFSPNNQLLASADTEGFVNLWDIRTEQPALPAWRADDYGVVSLEFSPDGNMLATGGVDDHIRLWDVDTGSETFGEALHAPLSGHITDVTAMAFHPNGKVLVSGDANSKIVLWDIDRESDDFGEPLERLDAKNLAGIRDLFFDPTGKMLIAFSTLDVTIWDISKNPPGEIQGYDYTDDVRWNFPVFDLIALDPDASILIMATIKSLSTFDFNLSSPTFGELLGKPIEEYSGRIFSINISPDDRLLASGDEYGRLQLWDMTSWLPLGPPLTAHDTDIYNLRFSPDGSKLASGDNGGNVLLWDTVLEHWIDIACRRANRNLTQQEWQRYFGDEPYRATCPQLPVETAKYN